LKVVSVEVARVNVPRKRIIGDSFNTSLGAARISEYVIVFVQTDFGITGIGEASSVFARRGDLLRQEISNYLAPALIDEDPFEIVRLADRMDAALDRAEPAKAALEMALWDIKGKALGTPVYNLLGGRVRDRIPLSFSIPFSAPDDAAHLAHQLVQQGFGTIKVKVGQDIENDVETVRRVREAVGREIRIRLDANMGFQSAKSALAFLERVAPFEPELFEQPLPARDLAGMAQLKERSSIPIMADESVWVPRDTAEVLMREAADIVSVYVSESGGLLNAWRSLQMCDAAGIPCVIGSMPELGVGTAAVIHLATAARNLPLACDACGTLYHDEHLLQSALPIDSGFAYAWDAPGLGVEIDQEALSAVRVSSQ
jgi:L-alanine-DL-glutamate epimerase-like enolase superfamily enzyme